MKLISQFYTLFWIIYFPSCLAFQTYTGIDWSDEVLCVVLMLFGFLEWKRRTKNGKLLKEMQTYWVIISFYTIYSLFIHVTSFRGVYLDLLQQIRPYMVFYMTMFMNPQFSKKQRKLIVSSMLLTMVVFYMISGAVTKYENGREDGELPMVALTTSMSYYLFLKKSKRNTCIATVIMLLGLISGKSKFMGMCVCFVAIVTVLRHKINYKNPLVYLMGLLLVAAVIFVTWAKFDSYYVKGLQKEDIGEMQARPVSYRVAYTQIIWDYFPFGSGLGTFGTAAAAKEYSPLYYKYHLNRIWGLAPDSPMFLADCFYPTLAEYGVVGIFLFCVFWKRRLVEIQKINDMQSYRMALMCVLALAINSAADTAYLSGAGMGLFMTLAICLNSNNSRTVKGKPEMLRTET